MCEALPLSRIKFEWKKIGHCDYSAVSSGGRYMLRAESMGSYYWWCVYSGDEQVAVSYDVEYKKPATSAKIAKLRALKAFNKWRKNKFV